jgi:hypothetical protein
MHLLEAKKYSQLSGEINSLYHEAAVIMGISDSVLDILYVICGAEDSCLQSEIYKMTGMSRQTINSAIHKLEKEGIVCLLQGQGRNTIVSLTEKGKEFSSPKIHALQEIENKIWSEWSIDERQQYLTLTEKYCSSLRKYMKEIFRNNYPKEQL